MDNSYVSAVNLGKSFAAKRVLENVSFSVNPGDVIGVLGKNGAGKTTLLELMLGFSLSTAGRVRVFGHDSHEMPGEAKARVGFVPQTDELVDLLSADDQLRLIASFYERWDTALIDRLFTAWGLDRSARVGKMSVGERQKLSILLALGHRPDLLVLDEPVASLDPIARRQFLEQIVEIAAEGQRSVIFSSHIVSDIERLANRIWIVKDGRLFWDGDLDSLKESFARVHVRGDARNLPGIPGALSVRTEGASTVALVRNWNEAAHAEIQAVTGGAIEVERLALEDLFVELHR